MSTPRPRQRPRLAPPLAAAFALAVGVAIPGLPAAPAAAEPAAFPETAAASETETITLITGDRVRFDPADPSRSPQVEPAEGREGIVFRHFAYDGHVYVVPSDAQHLIDTGKLDRRLFDVAGLAEDGHTDEATGTVPLILTGTGTGFTATEVPKPEIEQTWEDLTDGAEVRTLDSAVTGVWLDGTRELQLDESVPQIGAPAAWEAGYTGEGVTVAVLDSGVDADHPALAGHLAGTQDFSGTGDVVDRVGHGTHVASIIAGTGDHTGVAPDADLLIGKVCADDECSESAILAGMQWAAESGAAVVNLSVGGPDMPGTDPLEQAVDDLSAQYGTLFVTSAGNSGNGTPVSSPGSADAALSVGAVDGQDALADFSNAGSVDYSAVKPDLTAPGVDITAARATDTWLGEPVGEDYTTASGTSMAAPHVAGAAALLAQAHPDWTGAQLKAVLLGSAVPNEALGAFEQGAGRVSADRAVDQQVYATPASVSGGLAEWPHGDDAPVTETVTYRNTGDAEAVLDLAFTGDAPEGMFTLDRTTVTVPAGGSSDVQVTIDTTVASPDGRFSAYLTATGAAAAVSTPVAVGKESEHYDLTLTALDRSGGPVDSGVVALLSLETGEVRHLQVGGEGTTVRVPPGTYHVDAVLECSGGTEWAHLVQPELTVEADRTLTLDAGDAEPVDIRFEDEAVASSAVYEEYIRRWDGEEILGGVQLTEFDDFYLGALGEPVADEELESMVYGAWGIPDESGDFTSSPVAYHPVLLEYGQVPDGVDRLMSDEDFASVEAEYRLANGGTDARKSWWLVLASGWGIGSQLPLVAPFERTEFVSEVPGGQWEPSYTEYTIGDEDGEFNLFEQKGVLRRVEAGETYEEVWNQAVFGPGLPGDYRTGFAERMGDQIGVGVPMFGGPDPDTVGRSSVEWARTALYSGDDLVGEYDTAGEGYFDVPAENGEYRLVAEADRTGHAELATRVTATWEFSSAHTDDYTALPLMVVGLAPCGLDAENRALSRWTRVPMAVQTQDGPLDDAEVTLEYSVDDGQTWHEAPVWGGTGWIGNPWGSGYVSLRATADDGEGNTVTQEVIRAYGYR
ncbi:S8 family serine peptidase [Glycomyces arizonensis]|uniref:S8 family serine peptidase n=1 Tax=Glycomyces arizonensis TaxID=256035 RepID=UPI0004037398|nr:S8 family serine peptidase [Glycomyces arizonensis]